MRATGEAGERETAIRRLKSRLRGDSLLHRIVPLGVVEIIAWGTTFYSLGVLGNPIAADTGWSRSVVFAGISVGLIVSSALSSWAGRAIDAKGGRFVMALGACAAAAGHIGLALASTEAAYLAAWTLIGAAMRLTLYDAAFAALVQVAPQGRGRRAISYLTLFGGFASSLFWPIGHALAGLVGWRMALGIYAGLDLAVCLPLILLALAPGATKQPADVDPAPAAAAHLQPEMPHSRLEGRARSGALLLFGTAMSLNAFVWGAVMAHIVALLQSTGVPAATAVAVSALMGCLASGGTRLGHLHRPGPVGPGARTDRPRLAAARRPRAVRRFAAAAARSRVRRAAWAFQRPRHDCPWGGAAGAVWITGVRRAARQARDASALHERRRPGAVCGLHRARSLAAGEIALLIGAIASALVMEATIRWSSSHLRTRHSAE